MKVLWIFFTKPRLSSKCFGFCAEAVSGSSSLAQSALHVPFIIEPLRQSELTIFALWFTKCGLRSIPNSIQLRPKLFIPMQNLEFFEALHLWTNA